MAACAPVFLALTAMGLHDLQSRLERWDHDRRWTFYATTPGQLSCARYFSSATINDPVQCDIDVAWQSPWSLIIRIDGLLDWQVDMRTTVPTRLMSAIGARLPERAWANRAILTAMGRGAGPLLRVGQVRLRGTAANGQGFMTAPTRAWAVTQSRAVLSGEDLGPVGPLNRQARLGDFRLPTGHFRGWARPLRDLRSEPASSADRTSTPVSD